MSVLFLSLERPASGQHLTPDHTSATGIMSRRSVPDSPWQNGMPPFGFCQQPFNPMMNCGPMWAGQSNLPFMGGNMPPDMMRFGGNVPPRSYFRRSFDQPPDRYRTRQGFNDRYGNRQGYGRGDRKRPGPSDRSRSPASKRATQRRDGARRAEEETREGASEGETAATEEEAAEDGAAEDGAAEDGAAQADDLYDPAEPTTEDTVEGAEVVEGQEDDSGDVNQAGGNEDGGQEPGSSADKDEMGGGEAGPSTSTAKSGSKPLAKPATKAPVPKTSETKAPSKPADGKGQAGGRPSDKGRQEQGARRSGQKDKGWCTVCEIHFDGSFLDHRRTEDHKVKRDEKYPKCHACSMGFNNPKQYEHHCAGDLHRKNVEVLDNEVDETAGPLGEEYLEEVRAYYCTLCKLLLKVDLKSHHCCTQGHYRRHRDLKRKEEATKKAKLAKEKAEEEEDDTNQETYTITDEVGSDDEARAASDAAGEGASEPKRDVADEAQQEVSVEQPEGDHDVEEPEASEDKVDPLEGEGDNEQHAQQEEEEREDASELEAASAAASLLDEPKESDAADRNGCKGPEEDVAEENPAVVAPATTAARAAATSAATAGAPKATVSKLPPPKVAVKKVPAAKATVAVTKPSATAAKVPPPKAGTAANSAASTTGRAPSGAATAKTPVAPAASAAAAAAPGRGGMVRGRGRGLPPKAVRARKR